MSYCDKINPHNIRKDAECVLDFIVNDLKLKGNVGVYGRSLGGIASCHLAKKYPDIITAIIADRTFCDLEISSERRLPGVCTSFLYKFVSLNWKALNDRNFIEAK